MGKLISIEENVPHRISEVICLKCLHRWVAVRPETTLLKILECQCGAVGFVIETGELIVNDEEKQWTQISSQI